MNFPRSLLFVTTLALSGVCVSGCGKKTDTPKSPTVIAPATSQNQTPAETTATEDEPTSQAAHSQPAQRSEPAAAAVEESAADVAASTAESAPAETLEPNAAAPAESPDAAGDETAITAYKPASVALGAEPGGTTFKGRVTVKGEISEPPPITPQKDAHCIGLGTVPDESLVLGKQNGLGNVFVWVRKLPAGVEVPPPPKEPVSLDNVNCSFHPHAFVLRLGQPLFIKNSDPTGHNTHTSPLRNTAFNQLIPANDTKGIEVIYQREEILPVTTKCDIHPWMTSFHFPLEHPWAAVTDENGNFEITGLPAGELDFRLWHERMGYVERSVKVTFKDGQTVEKTFEVDAAKLKN